MYVVTNKKRRNFLSSLSITSQIILVNVIVFLVLLPLGFLSDASKIGYVAIQPNNILHGQHLWTIITSVFVHAGFFHIFANMLSLFFAGRLIERILGKKRFFWFYIFSGIFAGLFFVLSALIFTNELGTYAVGASGALFALVGLLMVLTPNLPVFIMFIPIPIKMKYAAPLMLAVLWFISIAGNIPIGNTAHLGGLIAGLGYGVYLSLRYKKKIKYIRDYFS